MLHKLCAAIVISAALLAARGQQPKESIASIEGLIRSRNYEQALESTKAALRDTPGDARLWTLRGIIFSIKGNNQDALSAFDKALELDPNNPAALKGEVQLLYQVQDKRAVPLLEKILKTDPKDATAHEMLANLEEKQGDCQAAISHFLLIADAIQTHAGSLQAYGACLVQTGDPQKAIPVFQQLANLIPDQALPKYDLAVLLVETKQSEAALKVLEPLLAADQTDPELLSLASEAYEGAGDTPKAVSYLRQAIVLNPENANYYNAFVVLCLDHESFQVGIDMVNAGLQRIASDPSLYISRGLLYAQLGQYEKAEADFNAAERLDSAQSLSAYAKDIVELQKDMSDKSHSDNALLEIRRQLKAHPDSPLLNFLLAKLLVYQESASDAEASREAIKYALLAVKLKPDLVEARDLLATIYTHAGEYNLAIDQCREALKYSPSDPTAIYHLIVALRHSGQSGQRDEIESLVKRLAVVQDASRKQQTDQKRFQLKEIQPQPEK
ncbi:MAG: tetratricopeptide repeat protein [Terracidiphilus sp.]|jgi:tetratricopeptide (TPR) repeat protein